MTLYDCRYNSATYAQPCDLCDETCVRSEARDLEVSRDAAEYWMGVSIAAEAEVERLRVSLLTVVEQVGSCCLRSGLCIDVDRIRAEAQRPMDGRA